MTPFHDYKLELVLFHPSIHLQYISVVYCYLNYLKIFRSQCI